MKKRLGAIVMLISAVALVGCGSRETAETTASETTAAASEAEADSSEAEAASGEKTVKRALVSNMMKPLSWMDSDGVVSGYEYDIMVELNNRLENYALEIEPVSEEVQDLAMETGDADISAGGYIPNENREKMYNIPDTPTAASSMMIYIRGEDADKIKNLADAVENGYELCPVAPNGGVYRALVEWNEANGNIMEEIPTQEGLNTAEKLQAVADGQYDMYINPNVYDTMIVAEEMGLDIHEVEEPISVDPIVLLLTKGDDEFFAEVNDALASMEEDGTMAEISEKYYGYNIKDTLNE